MYDVSYSCYNTILNLLLDKPTEDPRAVGDPYKTLFISRLLSIVTSLNLYLTNGFFLQNKQATENDISREFERYGKIERIRVVRDEKGRSKGYAFVVYERERDMKGIVYIHRAHVAQTHLFSQWPIRRPMVCISLERR